MTNKKYLKNLRSHLTVLDREPASLKKLSMFYCDDNCIFIAALGCNANNIQYSVFVLRGVSLECHAMSQVSPCISWLLSKLGSVAVKTVSVATER